MKITLPDLPYTNTALEPYISANTLSFHHGKHHSAYIANLNKLIANTNLENSTLEEIIQKTVGNPEKTAIFNNAAQVWNHTFYWKCMKNNGGGEPTGALLQKITENFKNLENFITQFKKSATGNFGSGWTWLIEQKNGKLEIINTKNADTPVIHNQNPLLTVDIWEHAYYLDYQNRRPDYLANFFEKLINWDFVAQNLR